ncbi:MAG: hypothetical protein ACI9R3_000887 [Verrucomicrobiales bacterium]|jgi:hypothetical protein
MSLNFSTIKRNPFARISTTSIAGIALLIAAATPSTQAQQSEFERMVYSFGNLETAAGTGGDEDGNFWKSEFEGAQATTIELSNPHMTMTDAAGNLYIADKESNSILKVDRQGIVTTAAGTHVAGNNGDDGVATSMQLNNPNGLFVFPDGTFYVLDSFNQRVCKVDRSGKLSTILKDAAGFGPGRGLWVSPDRTTLFYNGPGRVMRWTEATGSEVYATGFSDPGNITVAPNGNLIVTDRGAHVVYAIETDGTRSTIAGNGTDADTVSGQPATSVGLESVRGIAMRPDGSYFLCTQKGGDVVFVDSTGIATVFIAGSSSGNIQAGDGLPPETPGDKISEPRAISLAPNGDLIITTNDKGFVRIVRAVPPPQDFNIRLRNDGTPELTWKKVTNIDVDVDRSTNLRDWTPEAIELTSDSHPLDSAPDHFRLRAHRPYSVE